MTKTKSSTLFKKMKYILGLDDDKPPARSKSSTKASPTIAFSYFKKNAQEIKVLFPRTYSDAVYVAQVIREDIPVIINFEHLNRMSVNRFMDFISGTIYSMNGNLTKLADQVYLLTSERIEVSEETLKSKTRQKPAANEEIVVNLFNQN